MGGRASPVSRCTGVGTTVSRPHPRQVYMTHHRAAHAHVLPHHQPVAKGTQYDAVRKRLGGAERGTVGGESRVKCLVIG